METSQKHLRTSHTTPLNIYLIDGKLLFCSWHHLLNAQEQDAFRNTSIHTLNRYCKSTDMSFQGHIMPRTNRPWKQKHAELSILLGASLTCTAQYHIRDWQYWCRKPSYAFANHTEVTQGSVQTLSLCCWAYVTLIADRPGSELPLSSAANPSRRHHLSWYEFDIHYWTDNMPIVSFDNLQIRRAKRDSDEQ
jgi:hypothetical protein